MTTISDPNISTPILIHGEDRFGWNQLTDPPE